MHPFSQHPRSAPPADTEALLDALEREVLSQGPEAALPRKLSDEWLGILVGSLLNAMYDEDWWRDGGICAGPALLVATIADAQTSADPTRPQPRLLDCFARYRTALIEELLGRQTGVFRRPYSLVDIFV